VQETAVGQLPPLAPFLVGVGLHHKRLFQRARHALRGAAGHAKGIHDLHQTDAARPGGRLFGQTHDVEGLAQTLVVHL
jgi:hypothetical protein